MSGIPVLTIEDLRTYFYSRTKQAFIRSVGMPMYRAPCAFSAVAVRAFPTLVRFIRSQTATKATTERPAHASLVAGIMTPNPMSKLLPTKMP